VDWYKKPDAKAQIMLAVRRILRGKVSIDELNSVMEEIMEQAQARYLEWEDVA
jgi:type I restriction enzyme R subunit